MIGGLRSRRTRGPLRAAALAAGMLVAPLAHAETGWVDDQVRLNLRTGPGNQYRILDSVETGDSVEILSRGDGWIEVNADGKTGWVPDGYLQADPPAVVKLARIESEAAELRTRSKQIGEDAEKLRGEHEQLAAREAEQRTELERLTRDNLELRAGARWPEWIAGACILAVGMALGALLRGSARRQTPRIRL
ncbi:MAG TPA: TIGR04211 family SH3 domain-containing protein [Myxococcota bacterium]|jgi:SH3 domain protein